MKRTLSTRLLLPTGVPKLVNRVQYPVEIVREGQEKHGGAEKGCVLDSRWLESGRLLFRVYPMWYPQMCTLASVD